MNARKALTIFAIVLIAVTSFTFACRYNRVQAQNQLIAQFSGYEIIVAERNRTIASIYLGNLTVFKSRLIQENITTIYVEPYDSGSNYFTFYYPHSHWYYRIDVKLQYTGICQYRLVS